jgi:hypothetical protein
LIRRLLGVPQFVGGASCAVDLGVLPPGIYLIRLTAGGQSWVGKCFLLE